MGRLDGRVAIVTGSGGGIGRQHALLLASEGAQVVVNDIGKRTGASAASVVAEIETQGGVAVASTDSATWDGAEAIVGTAIDAFGRLDILVNNATVWRIDDIWRFDEADWDAVANVNLKGYFAMIARSTPHMARNRWGAIVNTSSSSGYGNPSNSPYAAAKEGVVGLTRTTAKELGRYGITCNAIRPLAFGVSVEEFAVATAPWTRLTQLLTGGTGNAVEDIDRDQYTQSKISPMVVWLCTDAARNITARTFHVFGDEVSLLVEPAPERTITMPGGWTLDALDEIAPDQLVKGLTNDFTFDDHPEVQVFEP
jgi:NAD(P)-dependent dehydrogenase (short-subunit alcohol dehydrogenase family)